MKKVCKHCGVEIVEMNYLSGKEWNHVNPNAGFPSKSKGSAWRYCKISVAEPKSEEKSLNDVLVERERERLQLLEET